MKVLEAVRFADFYRINLTCCLPSKSGNKAEISKFAESIDQRHRHTPSPGTCGADLQLAELKLLKSS